MKSRVVAALSVVAMLGAGGASAQSSGPSPAATPPKTGPSSGTEPVNSGSTGWTGGTGGSNTGTSPHAPTPGSPTEHPPTATGLDPTKPQPGGQGR